MISIFSKLITILIFSFGFISYSNGGTVDFQSDIEPIFRERCLDCHGPDKSKSAFRVDQRVSMIKGGDSGLPGIVPGNPNKSFLMEVVQGHNADIKMPPKGEKLGDNQIELIHKWINEGAYWPGQMSEVENPDTNLWSFQPVENPKIPESKSKPIDAFLNDKLKASGIKPNEISDARSLIRRVSIVLTGLPPKPNDVKDFEIKFSQNSKLAYESLVNDLMASPHFGERWAQHWLDAIRWAETNGSEANLYRKNSWVYRDYVIRAFNEDVPYNKFIIDQLAGDQIGVGEATGFLVSGPHVPAATVGAEPVAIRQARADRMDEIIQTVGASILGVTVSCARCHNHKFDPVSIQDYYSMAAVFQGVEFGGRWSELSNDHPRKQRAVGIYDKISDSRRILQEHVQYWEEDWGGYRDLHFGKLSTTALRIEFFGDSISIDELEVFGEGDDKKNYALASNGTKLLSDKKMTKPRGELSKANDGDYGTMAWRAQSINGVKPWVEIYFPKSIEVQRFRSSSNREYYFDTDYLEKNNGRYWSKGYRVLALNGDGEWREIADTSKAKKLINKSQLFRKTFNQLQSHINELKEYGPLHSFVGRFIKPKKTFVLRRGSPENPRDEVMPAGFKALGGNLKMSSNTPESERRMTYAKWLISTDHPLTSRVLVNRLWHHVFGKGIVATTSDFGRAGSLPTHPKLLDWLAYQFVFNDNWSMKKMIRRLVMSEAFQRSSSPIDESLSIDAESSLLWRYPPRRVEAEVIRDSILQASGNLNSDLGGRSYRIHNIKKTYAQWEVLDNFGPKTWRRMIYQERMRRVDDQMFTAFDFPDCGQIRSSRPSSTTPLQALNLMNSKFVVEQAEMIANRANSVSMNSNAAIKKVFELILQRHPDADELEFCRKIDLEIVARSLINSNEFAFLP